MGSNSDDRISTLPDDILVSIISRLELREAARTSILSRRWIDHWKYTTGVLEFEKPPSDDKGVRRDINWVSRVLNSHRGRTIDEFRVLWYDLDKRSSDVIDSWIQFALNKHVKSLVLILGCPNYALTRQAFSSCCRSSLTALHLDSVKVTGNALGYILSNSPLLQVLHVEQLWPLVELRVATPLPSLRRLEIRGCSMRCLELHAKNLESLTCSGLEMNVICKEIPRLIEANISAMFLSKNICCLSWCFSRLESLVLDFRRDHRMPKLPKFEKLKQLEVSFYGFLAEDYLEYCNKLLKASPLLWRLVIKIGDMLETKGVGMMVSRKAKYENHLQVKEIEFGGFYGHDTYVELVQHFLAKLPSLQKLVLDDRPVNPLQIPRVGKANVKTSAQKLQKFLPPGAKLVIKYVFFPKKST